MGLAVRYGPADAPRRGILQWRDRLHRPAMLGVLLLALTFNAVLCLVNTVAFRVSDVLVMGSEMLLISATLAFAIDRRAAFPLILAVFLAYMALLMAMRPLIDPKAVRDFLIPLAFYFAARRMPDPRLADRAALLSGLIVVGFGLFEYFALDTFTQYFNIIRYYVARGTVSPTELTGDSTLFTSGTRPDARNILPFLGQHRVSSVFLEPVSMGNFGAILILWALCRQGMAHRWWVFGLGAVCIILADARFGEYVCLLAFAMLVCPVKPPRLVWLALPFAILVALACYGFAVGNIRWGNDFGGRLIWTAQLVTSLDPSAVFGLSPEKPFFSDSGYAYSLNQIGLLGCAAFWALLIFAPLRTRQAWLFKMCAATYFVLLLVISDSPYSIKTAALLWFMVGTLDGARPDQLQTAVPAVWKDRISAAVVNG